MGGFEIIAKRSAWVPPRSPRTSRPMAELGPRTRPRPTYADRPRNFRWPRAAAGAPLPSGPLRLIAHATLTVSPPVISRPSLRPPLTADASLTVSPPQMTSPTLGSNCQSWHHRSHPYSRTRPLAVARVRNCGDGAMVVVRLDLQDAAVLLWRRGRRSGHRNSARLKLRTRTFRYDFLI